MALAGGYNNWSTIVRADPAKGACAVHGPLHESHGSLVSYAPSLAGGRRYARTYTRSADNGRQCGASRDLAIVSTSYAYDTADKPIQLLSSFSTLLWDANAPCKCLFSYTFVRFRPAGLFYRYHSTEKVKSLLSLPLWRSFSWRLLALTATRAPADKLVAHQRRNSQSGSGADQSTSSTIGHF